MKICFLTSSVSRLAGGLVESLQLLTQHLCIIDGLQVEVLSVEDAHSAVDIDRWRPVKPRLFPPRGLRSFGYAVGMSQALTSSDTDLVHNHGLWMYPSVLTHNWGRKTGKPFLVTPHGMLDPWALANSRWKKRLAGALFESRHLTEAACIHSLCEAETAAIRRYGLKNPICQIPNGIELPTDTDHTQPPWSDKIPCGSKVLLYLGRIHPKKGLPNLLASWRSLREELGTIHKSWTLAIAGWDQDGHEAELKAQARESALDDTIVFLGPLFGKDKKAAYQHADAFILPSFSEGLPMVVLEAWAYRLPVVMTVECNIPEGFAHNAAIKIAPDVFDIACGLRKLFSLSDSELKEMGLNGHRLIERQFTWPKITAEMKAVYEWVLGGGAPPDCVRLD